jgi:hypothetical protein
MTHGLWRRPAREAARRADRQVVRETGRRAWQRERSQPAGMSVWRLRRPGQRPGHQASTAHVQAAYPAVTEAVLGSRGVFIGMLNAQELAVAA